MATPSNKKGTFGASNVTVNYVYKANGYALITTYKDTQGKDLKPLAIDTKTYNINDPYTATALNIPGYTLTTTPANEKVYLAQVMKQLITYIKQMIIR